MEVSLLVGAAVELTFVGAIVEFANAVEFAVGTIIELELDGAIVGAVDVVGAIVGAMLGDSVGGIVVGDSVVHNPHALVQNSFIYLGLTSHSLGFWFAQISQFVSLSMHSVDAGITMSSALSGTMVVFEPNSVDAVCNSPLWMASSIAVE